jgi:hypothetical protein
MGARNAKAALAAWGDRLPATPMLVLLAMALTAHDDDDDPRYWGGRARLLGALGRDPESRADQKSLERALRTLVDVGAVTLLNRPRVGVRARYRNILEPSLTLRLQVGAKVSKLGRRTGATSPRPGQGKNHKIRRTVTKNAATRRQQPSPASRSRTDVAPKAEGDGDRVDAGRGVGRRGRGAPVPLPALPVVAGPGVEVGPALAGGVPAVRERLSRHRPRVRRRRAGAGGDRPSAGVRSGPARYHHAPRRTSPGPGKLLRIRC